MNIWPNTDGRTIAATNMERICCRERVIFLLAPIVVGQADRLSDYGHKRCRG